MTDLQKRLTSHIAMKATEPKPGETWKFPMTSPSTGRTVWWTRKIQSVYGADGDRWCDWNENRMHLRKSVPVEIVMAGERIS